MPAIWTKLWIVGHSNRDPKLDAIAVGEYATRSRSLPMEIKVYYHAPIDGWREDKRFADGLYAVLEQVRKCAYRCRALDVCFPDMMLVAPIVNEINRNDTLLPEELRIEMDRLPETGATLPSTTHVPALPQLRILEFKTRTPSIPYFKAPVAGLVSALRHVSIFQRLSWDDFYA